MTGRMRFAPCPEPGCPELAESCPRHRHKPWAGRNGSTRTAALGCSTATWEKLKRAAIRRDGSRCRRCGAPGVEVDHLVPVAWRRPSPVFREHLAGLGVLCSQCHRRKTNDEATIGRTWGSPPPLFRITEHARYWGSSRAAV